MVLPFHPLLAASNTSILRHNAFEFGRSEAFLLRAVQRGRYVAGRKSQCFRILCRLSLAASLRVGAFYWRGVHRTEFQ